jgi:hypothetical protein
MFFPRVAGLFGSALFLISSTAGHAGATEIKVDPFVEKQRGFLRDVATAADGNGLLVSDAVAPAESYVQLSDEEILADNPDLARFFEMIEDDEKYAKWEKEEMPQILLEIKASRNSGRTKQKKWARKAMVKSEIEACWVRSYWKKAAYWAWCSRWKKVWFASICIGHSCHSGDNLVWPLCHRGCKGWSDDGFKCYKKCASQSTTPSACGHMMCSADAGACVGAIANMVVSIASMLASVFPAGKVAVLAKQMAKAASKAAMKALLKQFAKSIAKRLLRKTKRKVKKFMKAEIKGLKKSLREEAVESILQEAAEAFAIERAKKEVGYQVPSIEDIARACDPIGVMDVIDAFNLNSCDDTEIENFPTCSDSTTYFHSASQIETMIQAEDNCCFGYYTPWRRYVRHYGYRYVTYCRSGSHVLLTTPQDGEAQDAVDPWVDDDPGDEGVDPDSLVDVLYDDPPMSGEDRMFCELCVIHDTCEDNQVEGANLTAFDECTARQCCSAPEGFVGFHGVEERQFFTGEDEVLAEDVVSPEDSDPGHFTVSRGRISVAHGYGSIFMEPPPEHAEEPAGLGIDCAACEMFGMCAAPGPGWDLCSEKGCCDGFEDPNEDNWIPPPLPDDNSTDTATGTEIVDQPDQEDGPPGRN